MLKKIILNFRNLFKYKLNKDEQILWESIVNKAELGYNEWYEKTKGDDMCGPWINTTKEENDLLDKIHKYYYGDNWWVSFPISTAQVNFIIYEDIKNKIKY